jgi:hypothetical protein
MIEQLPNNGETGASAHNPPSFSKRKPRKKLNPTIVVKPIRLLYSKVSNRH